MFHEAIQRTKVAWFFRHGVLLNDLFIHNEKMRSLIVKLAPGSDRFLGVNTQQKVSLLVRFKCRRHDAVGSRLQLVTSRHLTHVDELRRLADRRVVLEKVEVQRPAVWILQLHSAQQNYYVCDSNLRFQNSPSTALTALVKQKT